MGALNVSWPQPLHCLQGAGTVLCSDPSAWSCTQSLACGSPVKNQKVSTSLFYYLANWEHVTAANKAPECPDCTQTSSWHQCQSLLCPRQRKESRSNRARVCTGGRRAGMGAQSSAGDSAVPRVHQGSRQGWVALLYVMRSCQFTAFTSWGAVKHKLHPSPLFSAPERENMICTWKGCHAWQFSKEKAVHAEALQVGGAVCSTRNQLGPSFHLGTASGDWWPFYVQRLVQCQVV